MSGPGGAVAACNQVFLGQVLSGCAMDRCHNDVARLATRFLFSVILIVPAQTYERLCFGEEFPVFCSHVTVWTSH
jgi:hypothetical protein